MAALNPCPCCGYLVFSEPVGSYDICPICRWEDDAMQLRWPGMGGANLPLLTAQANYQRLGVSTPDLQRYAREPIPGRDLRDPLWRPLDPARDLSKPTPEGGFLEAIIVTAGGPPDEPYYWLRRGEPDED
jgi:hypothetical protein